MTLDITAQVRLRIQDRARYASEEFLGDGYNATFKLTQGSPYSVVVAPSAQIRLASAWSATGASFDTGIGLMSFSGTISANSACRAVYMWSVFSDDEVTNFIQAGGGSVAGAALEAVNALMFDGLRRARWSAPDGSSYDDTAAISLLKELEKRLWEEVRESPEGGIASWSEQQQYYQSEYPS